MCGTKFFVLFLNSPSQLSQVGWSSTLRIVSNCLGNPLLVLVKIEIIFTHFLLQKESCEEKKRSEVIIFSEIFLLQDIFFGMTWADVYDACQAIIIIFSYTSSKIFTKKNIPIYLFSFQRKKKSTHYFYCEFRYEG